MGVEKGKKRKKEVFVDYYSLIICRSSGNMYGWFCSRSSRNCMNGVLIALFFGVVREIEMLQQSFGLCVLHIIISSVKVCSLSFGAVTVTVIVCGEPTGVKPVPLGGKNVHDVPQLVG